jgi:hypothetical protein
VDQQDGITTRTSARVKVHNNDIVGIFSYNIFVGIAVATIFGSGFFFDLFWPERKEIKSVRLAWKICSLLVSIMALGDALALTVSVIAWNERHVFNRLVGYCCNASFNYYRSISSNSNTSLPREWSPKSYLQEERLLRCVRRSVVAGHDSIICQYFYYVEVNST